MKQKLLFLALMLGSPFLYAQHTLLGQVQDKNTLEPLANASLILGEQYATSDRTGLFKFTNVSPGIHQLQVLHVGREMLLLTLDIRKDTQILIQMSHHIHQFEEVTSYAHLKDHEPDSRKKSQVDAEEIQRKGVNQFTDAIAGINGVRQLKTGPTISKPILNGMHSNRIAIIDGQGSMESQQWGSEHSPEIDPFSLGSIEVIKGVGSLIYGGSAIGGIIRLVPEEFGDTNLKQWDLVLNGQIIGSNGGGLATKYKKYNQKKRLGQSFTLSGNIYGDNKTPTYYLSNTAVRQLSASYTLQKSLKSTKLQWVSRGYIQKLGILSASHIGNLNDLEKAINSDTPLITRPFTYSVGLPYQFIQHYNTNLSLEHDYAKIGKLKLNYSLQWNKRQEFDVHNPEQPDLGFELITHQLFANVDKHQGKYLRHRYGLSAELQQNFYEGRYFIPNYQRIKPGGYYLLTLERSSFLWEAGLRYDLEDYNTYRWLDNQITTDHLSFPAWSAALSGWKKINHDLRLHLTLGSKYRAPSINELYSAGLHHGSANIEIGNINLKQERSYSVAATGTYNHNKLKIELEPYLHYIQNYINLEPTGINLLTINGAFPKFVYTSFDALFAGIDYQVFYNLYRNTVISTSGNFLSAQRLKDRTNIYGTPPSQAQLSFKQSKKNMGSVNNAYYKISTCYTMQKQNLQSEQDIAPIPEGYLLVNFEAGADHHSLPFIYYIKVDNIFNKEYRDYLNRYRYFANETGTLISLSLHYKF